MHTEKHIRVDTNKYSFKLIYTNNYYTEWSKELFLLGSEDHIQAYGLIYFYFCLMTCECIFRIIALES